MPSQTLDEINVKIFTVPTQETEQVTPPTASASVEQPAPANGDAPTKGEAPTSASKPPAPQSLAETLRAWIKEFLQFGLVGATAFVIDMGLFNLLQHGPLGVLAGHANTANAVAASVATIYSWIMNRVWTYRGRTQENAGREAFLFFFANLCGIGITQFCLLFSHHILGLTSPLADNISAYVVGFALGTAFRFVFYHYVVFTGNSTK